MKTNQMMEVRINEDLSFQIGHKTRMGKVDSILAYGNLLREQRGLKPISMGNILKKQDFWEFIIARNTQNFIKIQTSESEVREKQTGVTNVRIDSDYTMLDGFKTSKGEIQYSKLVKEFPTLIKSQRGGKVENRGYWMDLHILLKVAAMLDKDLEVQIYDIFINGQILENRDNGGDAFKLLNKVMRKLSGFEDHFDYIRIAEQVRDKLGISDDTGYNDGTHNNDIQAKRDKIIRDSVMVIKAGFVNSVGDLHDFIEKI